MPLPEGFKPVSAYLPPDILSPLTDYCLEHSLTRKDKQGNLIPSLGSGIVEVLREFFKGNVSSSLPSALLSEDELMGKIEKLIKRDYEENRLPLIQERIDEWGRQLEQGMRESLRNELDSLRIELEGKMRDDQPIPNPPTPVEEILPLAFLPGWEPETVQPMENSSLNLNWEGGRPDNIPVQSETETNSSNGEGDRPTLIPPDRWLDGNGIRIKLNQDIPYSPKDWKKGNIVLISTFNPFKKLFSRSFCMVDTDVSVRASIDQVDEIYVDWSFKLHNQDYPKIHPNYPDYLRDLGIPIFNWDREKVLGDFDPDALFDPDKPIPVTEPNSALEENVIKINLNIPTETTSTDTEINPMTSDLDILKKGLTGAQLTRRLGYKNGASLRGLKDDEDLARVTKAKDPDNLAWRRAKNEDKKGPGIKGYIYYPITSDSHSDPQG